MKSKQKSFQLRKIQREGDVEERLVGSKRETDISAQPQRPRDPVWIKFQSVAGSGTRSFLAGGNISAADG